MCLIVDVTSATSTLFRYAYAADLVRRMTGRRPIGAGKLAQKISNCVIGVCGAGEAWLAAPTQPHRGKHRQRCPAACDTLRPSPALQSPIAPCEPHCG